MIIHYTLRRGQPLTPEQEKRLDALSEMSDDDIVYDEDSPETTEEDFEETVALMKKYKTRRITKEMIENERREKENQKIAS